jgi:hypothetical protein
MSKIRDFLKLERTLYQMGGGASGVLVVMQAVVVTSMF